VPEEFDMVSHSFKCLSLRQHTHSLWPPDAYCAQK